MADEMNGMPQDFEYGSRHDLTLSTSLDTLMFANTTLPSYGTTMALHSDLGW
jgi:hypothetical protein